MVRVNVMRAILSNGIMDFAVQLQDSGDVNENKRQFDNMKLF